MVEQNIWRNYQTKLLGGGLLLIALIIIAALLSHYNHAPVEKKEVELAIEPQISRTDSATSQNTDMMNNQPQPLTTIEVAKVDIRPSTATSAPKPIVAQPVAQPTSAESMQTAPITQPSGIPTPTPEQPAVAKQAIEMTKPMPAHSATPVVSHTKAMQAKVTARNKAVATSKIKPLTKNSPYSEAEKCLLAIPKTHYTLQLVGANSSKHIQAFIKMHGLQGKASYYQTYNNGKPWYVIVYGNYKTKAQAQAALKKLPTAVQAQHPWPRDYATVHAAIQRKLS